MHDAPVVKAEILGESLYACECSNRRVPTGGVAYGLQFQSNFSKLIHQ